MTFKEYNFQWSLKPIVNLLKMFGYLLENFSPGQSKSAKFVIHVFGLLVCLTSFALCGLQLLNAFLVMTPTIIDATLILKNIGYEMGDDICRMMIIDIVPPVYYSCSAVQLIFIST